MRNELAVEGIRSWVSAHLGLQFDHERVELLESRLAALCKKLDLSMADLWTGLDDGDHALSRWVADEISTNHTMFLREPEMFGLLTSTILPGLAGDAEVRIWSAACSSGEEAYSIGMCAVRALGLGAARARVRILGTDISARQIAHAERGIYDRAKVSAHAAGFLEYFVDAGPLHVQVCDELAELCTFRRLNLVQPQWPFERRFHVIFLRNILYYFAPAKRRHVLASCHAVSAPGAWLITSVTEPMLETCAPWVALAPGVYRNVEAAR